MCDRYLVSCCVSHSTDCNNLTKYLKRVRKQERAHTCTFGVDFSRMKCNDGNYLEVAHSALLEGCVLGEAIELC